MGTHRQVGFTLIELLIALVVLTIISIAGYRGLNSVLETRERVAAETRKWQHLTFFFSRLEMDIAQAVHRPVRDSAGIERAEWIGHTTTSDEDDAELTFTRAGIPDQGTQFLAPQRIAYRLEHEKIVMLRWPELDQSSRAKPTRYDLLKGVSEFKLRYLDGSNQWQEQWLMIGKVSSPPSAVEINLTLVSGEKITRVFALQ